MRQRNEHIETLRGIAIILLVYYHWVGYCRFDAFDAKSIIQIPFEYFRMPLFTVISGFVYSMYPVTKEGCFRFLKMKELRLGLPLICWSIPTYIAFSIMGSREPVFSLIDAVFFPCMQYWFLQVMLLIFPLVVFLELAGFLRDVKRWILIFILSIITLLTYRYFYPGTTTTPFGEEIFFSWTGVLYLFPFFILGVGIERFFYYKYSLKYVLLLVMIALASSVLLMYEKLGLETNVLDFFGAHLQRDQLVGMVGSLAAVLALVGTPIRSAFLAYVGNYAYPIYLIHILIFIFLKQVFDLLGFEGSFSSQLVSLVCVFIISIILTKMFSLHWLTRLFLLGDGRRR